MLAVSSLGRLQLGACSYALTAVLVNRRLTQPCPTTWLVAHDQLPTSLSGRGDCQKVLRRASYLLSSDIPWEYRRPLPLVQASNTVIVSSSLSSGTSDTTKALGWTVFIFGSDCSELWCRGPPSSPRSDNLIGTFSLAKPMLSSIRTELRRKEPPSFPYNDSEVPTLVGLD